MKLLSLLGALACVAGLSSCAVPLTVQSPYGTLTQSAKGGLVYSPPANPIVIKGGK